MPHSAEDIRIKRNLTALVEFSRAVNSSLSMDFTLNNLLLSCFGKFLTTKGFVAINSNGFLTPVVLKGINKEELEAFPKIPAENTEESKSRMRSFVKENNLKLCEPIVSSRGLLGCIVLGEKINKSDYSEDEVDFLRTILSIAATSIENSLFVDELRGLNRDLDKRLNRLSSLFELSKEFGALIEEERISRLLVYSLLGNFLVSSYAICYLEDKKLKVIESTVPKQPVLDYLGTINLQSVTNPVSGENLTASFEPLSKLKINLIIPMKYQNETRGLILLGKRMNLAEYSDADIEFITSVGNLAIMSLENRRLFKEALEKQRLEEELEIAKDIQRNLLPKNLPQFEEYDIAAMTVPSKQVGGDYYDIISTAGEDVYLAIADVSGKGVPASLLMANLQAFLKSITIQNLGLSDATGLLNNLVTENTSEGRFITFFWCKLLRNEKKLIYVNAGHNPPLLIRNNKLQYLDKGGMIFGVMKTFVPYAEEIIDLQSGDLLVLFTDGVTEAKNRFDREFTDEKLETLMLGVKGEMKAGEIMNMIKSEIDTYVEGFPQSDDITMIVVKVK